MVQMYPEVLKCPLTCTHPGHFCTDLKKGNAESSKVHRSASCPVSRCPESHVNTLALRATLTLRATLAMRATLVLQMSSQLTRKSKEHLSIT